MSNIGILSGDNSWEKYVNDVTGKKPIAVEKDKHDPLNDIDETEKEISIEENKTDSELLKENKPFASMVAFTIDIVQAGLFSFIAGSESDKFRLSKSDRAEYEQMWCEYFKEKKIDVSPGVVLAVSSLAMFGKNGMTAFQLRKENKKQLKQVADGE